MYESEKQIDHETKATTKEEKARREGDEESGRMRREEKEGRRRNEKGACLRWRIGSGGGMGVWAGSAGGRRPVWAW